MDYEQETCRRNGNCSLCKIKICYITGKPRLIENRKVDMEVNVMKCPFRTKKFSYKSEGDCTAPEKGRYSKSEETNDFQDCLRESCMAYDHKLGNCKKLSCKEE